jgi:hypothetical protein
MREGCLAAVLLAGCATRAASRPYAEAGPSVANYGRPRGMAIGTGATGGDLERAAAAEDDAELATPEEAANNRSLAIPKFDAPATPVPAAAPCSGCVELKVDVSDINQRDEFAFDAGGIRATRVVWTILVDFNSDQLAVQPFVDTKRGKYTALHVNTFPLGAPVRVEQEYTGKAGTIGLIVGSSGAWTGNQTMSVFVDAVHVEGPVPIDKTFDADPQGLTAHNADVAYHPRAGAAQ